MDDASATGTWELTAAGWVAETRRLLWESWAPVEERGTEFARYVFARLFLAHPQTRALFPVAMHTPQAQLVTAVRRVAELYGEPALEYYLRALHREHRKYQLCEYELRTLALAVLDGVREFNPAAWSGRHDQAWTEAVQLVARTIRAGARAGDGTPANREAEVLSHRRLGADVAVLTVVPDGPVLYHPGQHLPVATPYQPRVWRDFSIANAPRADGTLDLHVRAVGGGLVSGALVRRVRPGDRLLLGAPSGGMALDRRSTSDIVCVAVGTGLAPIKALVEELTTYNRTRWVHLFYAGTGRDDLYDLPALRRLAARHPWLSVVPVLSADPGYPAEHGTADQVVGDYGPWPDHDCFVAGPVGDVQATVEVLGEVGVPGERIATQCFETAVEPELPLPALPQGPLAIEAAPAGYHRVAA